jgi:hypothetical protein
LHLSPSFRRNHWIAANPEANLSDRGHEFKHRGD